VPTHKLTAEQVTPETHTIGGQARWDRAQVDVARGRREYGADED